MNSEEETSSEKKKRDPGEGPIGGRGDIKHSSTAKTTREEAGLLRHRKELCCASRG